MDIFRRRVCCLVLTNAKRVQKVTCRLGIEDSALAVCGSCCQQFSRGVPGDPHDSTAGPPDDSCSPPTILCVGVAHRDLLAGRADGKLLAAGRPLYAQCRPFQPRDNLRINGLGLHSLGRHGNI